MREVLLGSEHHLGRLIAQIAHGSGVPMALLRFDDHTTLPPAKFIDHGFKSFVDELVAGGPSTGCDDWMAFVRKERFRLFASGRRYEHPFVTLLRNEPWWSVWELAVLHQTYLQNMTPDELVEVRFPGSLGDLLQMKVQSIVELNGLMVYGPVPRERGFSGSEITSSIRRFDEAAQNATRITSRYKAGGYSSYERLRRMYFANGRTIDKLFDENIKRARNALALSLDADLRSLKGEPSFNASILLAIESVASVALTRVTQGKKARSQFRFRGPASADSDIEIVVEAAGLRVKIAKDNRDQDGVDISDDSTGIELSSLAPEDGASHKLQDVIAQAEDRNAQAMLQQFMLMRHWLSDRYARLSPMYNGAALAADDAAKSLEEIVEWLLRLFDADFAAIYHAAGGGVLEQIAFGSRGTPAADYAAKENSRHMRDLAVVAEGGREKSSAYRALANGMCEHVRDWDGQLSVAGMSASVKLKPQPRSTVAAPIIVLGRTWGVIELVGFFANQFDKISSMWIEEASQLVGNALYQTWLLKQITHANMAVLLERENHQEGNALLTNDGDRNRHLIAVASRDKEARLLAIRKDICREMAELFVADGAGLWLNNEQWPGRIQLRGCFGIDFDPARDAPPARKADEPLWPEIDIGLGQTLVSRMMRGDDYSAEALLSESLESPTGDVLTARDAYRVALWRSGVRRITLVPLLETSPGTESRPIGALALYSKLVNAKGESYGRRWLPLVEFAGRHVAMLMRSIALESERQNSLELMFSHEVIGSLRRVKDQFDYLVANLLGPLERGRRPDVLQHPERLKDIYKATSRVENGIADALDRLDEMRREGFQMPTAGLFDFRSKSEWDGAPSVLFNAIQSGFNARYRFRVARRLDWRITGTTEFIRIQLNPRDLETLFYNLADNALKYASKGTSVRVNIERRPTGNLYVDFFNTAPPLRPGEADRLFKLGFRGQLAHNGDEDGRGQGLFITQMLTQALGVGLDYDWSKTATGSDVEHRFRLIFNEEMVIYGRG